MHRCCRDLWWLVLMWNTCSYALSQEVPTVPARPPVLSITLHDTLQPVSAQMLQQELETASEQHPSAILLDLSTPGGTAESAMRMAQSIRQSASPVVVYLHEPKTQVAGEGLRLLMAGAAAVMAPETRLVPLREPHRRFLWHPAERRDEIEALISFVATSMEKRGKNPGIATELLRSTGPISSAVALQAGLVDGVAVEQDAIPQSLYLTPARSPHGLPSLKIITVPMTGRQHLMRALMNPDLTVLLLTLGALLIFLEMNTPGTIAPGMAGVLLVMLSLYGLFQMPLNWQGIVLLLLSAAMLLAETQFARGNLYGVIAVLALTLGLRLLVTGPIPELEVDWSTSIGAGVGFGGITAGLALMGVRARRAKQKTGAEAMLGWMAVTQTPLQPMGEVLVRGELWRARLSAGNSYLPSGECVKVQATDGGILEVAPMTLNLQNVE